MRTTGRFATATKALRIALAAAALSLPLAASAATQTYNIAFANLVGQTSTCCGNSYYNGCGGVRPGFMWNDILPGGSTINSVTVRMNDGVDCHSTGNVFNTSLNGIGGPTWSTPFYDCFCCPSEKIVTLNLPASAYSVGVANTFLTTNPISCLGNAVSGTLGGFYAIVTVDYTAGTGGGGGTCNLAPIEAKLDDGTRFTSDAENTAQTNAINNNTNSSNASQTTTIINTLNPAIARLETKLDDGTRFTSDAERTAQTNTLTTEINQNETAIGRLETKLDTETRFVDDAELNAAQQALETSIAAVEAKLDSMEGIVGEMQIQFEREVEHALGEDHNINKPLAIYLLPAAHGGLLERVRDLVDVRIDQMDAAGCPTGSARALWTAANGKFASSQYDEAYAGYSQAYITASGSPCN